MRQGHAGLIATLPTRMVRRYGMTSGLEAVAVPMTLNVPNVSLAWAAQEDNDPAPQWLRGEIVNIPGRMPTQEAIG